MARDLSEGQGGVLLHLGSGQYHGINQVGAVIWELIQDGCTSAEAVERLRGRVDDLPPQLEADVLRFLKSAHERDLIVLEQ